MNRTNGQREYLGMPLCGRESEQVVSATGDTDGNRAAAKAQALHAQRAAEVDRQAQRADDRRAAAEERGSAADTRRTDRQTQRAAWKAARQARKGDAA
jgi:hypothetical protein